MLTFSIFLSCESVLFVELKHNVFSWTTYVMLQHLCEYYSNRFVCEHLDEYNIWLIVAKADFVLSVDNMCSFQWDD
jgi:hypothetical protein